ncbi:MAG: phosphoesterase [Armatimonadetes bacterium]|nr:phosphoesterase [Armatimonadota bacterium]
MEEQVLVVPRVRLFSGEAFFGFSGGNPEKYLAVVKAYRSFRDRSSVEHDPSWKQIIPYVVLTWNDRIFATRRLSTQTEERLHNLISVGIGGHINPCDGTGDDVLERAMLRELEEEMILPWKPEASLAGFLNDDTTDVGSVHFGLVYRIECPAPDVAVRERDKMIGEFLTFGEARSRVKQMESWSRFVVEAPELVVHG